MACVSLDEGKRSAILPLDHAATTRSPVPDTLAAPVSRFLCEHLLDEIEIIAACSQGRTPGQAPGFRRSDGRGGRPPRAASSQSRHHRGASPRIIPSMVLEVRSTEAGLALDLTGEWRELA